MPVTLYGFPPLPNPQKALLALEEFGIPYTLKTVNVLAAENLSPDFLSLNANGTVPVLIVPLEGQQQKIITESSEIVLNAAARGQRAQTCDAALVKKWVADFDSWSGPLYTLANDTVLKNIISNVDAYKIQLSEARQDQYPALKEAYSRAASRYRQAGKTLHCIAHIPCLLCILKLPALKWQTFSWLYPSSRLCCVISLYCQLPTIIFTIICPHLCAFASGAAIGDAATIADVKKQLVALLDAAEAQLSKTAFLAGDTYSAADVMLTCAVFLVEQAKQTKLELAPRPNLSKWWKSIKQRPSYKAVFGPATSPVTLLTMVLPAVSKVMVKKLLHQY